MKTFVGLCVLALVVATQAASLTAEQSAKFLESLKTCFESSHVDKALVIRALGGDFAEDEHLDDFFTCMFKRLGLFDDEGNLQKDVLKAKAPADVSREDIDLVFSACAKAQEEPKSKIAKSAYKCYLTETPVKIQLIPV